MVHVSRALSLGTLWPSHITGPSSAKDTWLPPFPPQTEDEVEGAETCLSAHPECTLDSGESMAEKKQSGDSRNAADAFLSTLLRRGYPASERLIHMQPLKINIEEYLLAGNLFMKCC